ncbi:MAG: carboxypeptidase-like regulatory domain-containing protein, partial [Alphaproteobacteria bacterium]
MVNQLPNLGVTRAIAEYASWTDRIAAGELPFEAPPRPQGMERNLVVTQWDWAEPTTYLHDTISSDRRDPTVNANGKLYGSPEWSTDNIPVLDPISHQVSYTTVPVADPNMHTSRDDSIFAPSPFWGDEPI